MTNMSNFKASIEAMNNELNLIKKNLSVKIKESFEDAIQESLNGFLPQVKGVNWTQYTPYFADGDTCVFGVNTPSIVLDNDDEDFDGDPIDAYTLKYYAESPDANYYSFLADLGVTPEDALRIRDILNDFENLLQSIGDDAMQDAFGDHAKVTVKYNESKSRWVISVDYYDHE